VIPLIRHLPKSKIHRATVTEANIEYEGSVTIDRNLMDAADLLPYERVDIWNCTNGNRLTTYVIEGERGEGQICINGAAAHLMKPGDLVIIASWTEMEDAEARAYDSKRVFVDHENRIRD
jgi:aspartate 1-decarboxylase